MAYKMAILSMGAGRAAVQSMEAKLDALAAAGFQGIEIFFEDLVAVARQQSGHNGGDNVSDDSQIEAARTIRQLCDARGITVIGLQPFLFYEGLTDRAAHDALIRKLHLWFQLVRILGTDIIQVPSNFAPRGITGDKDIILKDLTELADLGLHQTPVVRFAYEPMAWGTFVDTWEAGWELVTKVERPNFGMVLDTFQIASRVWADPTAVDGKNEGADELLSASLDRLVATVDLQKIFYIQVGDVEPTNKPLTVGHPWFVSGQPARMNWGRAARTFANDPEVPGCLPVAKCADAFIRRLGYKGWVSCEIFSRHLEDPDPSIPKKFARRAAAGWYDLLKRELSLDV
jgi:4-hydroxyphenylpyruvate dioxygenase